MIFRIIKRIYDHNKTKSSLFYQLIKGSRAQSYLSRKYKHELFRTHILKSSNEIIQLNNLLYDNQSREVLKMIVEARKDNIYKADNYYFRTEPQYFIDELSLNSNVYTLIDVGAYNGDTLQSFINYCSENYNYIYCFEPDYFNFEKLELFVLTENINRIRLENKGVYNTSGIVSFSPNNLSTSKIDNNSNFSIETVTLDDYFDNITLENSLLKMDIEGAEPEALKGSHNFINNNMPVMAICIYHEPEHLFNIPLYIKKHFPSYDLLIRHHSNDWTETVLYCLPQNQLTQFSKNG
jgi:FkbM family methyltransferase